MTPEEVSTQLDKDIFHFICGPAGSGKTYLIKKIRELDQRAVLTATTGIASVELGFDATTINSYLGGYYDVEDLAEAPSLPLKALKYRTFDGTRAVRIFIDEVSMLSDRHLELLVAAIEKHNKHAHMPVSLILTGDHAQLPPVDGDYCFESDCWKEFEKNTIELKGTHRQADQDFIQALRYCRSGNSKKALDYFRPMIRRSLDEDFFSTMLFYKNIDVSRYNKKKVDQLGSREDVYETKRTGKQLREWSRTKIPDNIRLRSGSIVMVLANAYEGHRWKGEQRRLIYANGDLGVYREKVSDDQALIELHRDGREVVIQRVEREGKGMVKGESRRRVVGGISYMPLRPAYASTVHKVQGLSLDAVQVVITDSNFGRTPGLLYVALSRAKTPEGIRIIGTPDLFIDRCKADSRIERWL